MLLIELPLFYVHAKTGVYIVQNTMARGGKEMVPGKKMKKKEKGERKKKKRERGRVIFLLI